MRGTPLISGFDGHQLCGKTGQRMQATWLGADDVTLLAFRYVGVTSPSSLDESSIGNTLHGRGTRAIERS
jgi:hypothetical protein